MPESEHVKNKTAQCNEYRYF